MAGVDYMLLVHAFTPNGQIFDLQGAGWDTHRVPRFPAVISKIRVAFRIRLGWEEVGKQIDVVVDVVDMDGASLAPDNYGFFHDTFVMPEGSELTPGDPHSAPGAVELSPIHFQRAGIHEVILRIDGVVKGSTVLHMTGYVDSEA
jgi:hypothetical protein